MSPEFLGIAAVACWLAVVVATALLVRRRWPEQREWSRKVVHIGTGPVVLIAWAMGIGQGVALPAAALVTVLTALNHRYRLLPAVEDVGRHSYGTIAYGAAITILLALFWPQQPLPVAAGVLVMALGDGLAGLIGPQIPSIRWQVLGQTKSLAGTGAMAAASLLALGGLTALASGLGLAAPSWPSLLLLTGVATGLEQLSRYGGDNLTVPLATGMLWQQLSG
ncbi:dolichol kinase [Synechococcus sp. HJ21-Hayes]|uniref:diacylglycerol/polyprenol kinase family protein n=1 Tax=unclassified Synechococcus TaxID=2626047 RepID=UPI0020CE43A8|nr:MULTISPECIES: dolichol kinase [unclassified Synechococcus]MCP9832577.1 dolichol kinase [Synechococcus sp. JJ3a-Johnson]MCP9854184.1 dolichol kinase [Synechococcus sp. HJ21-Hayes]